MPGIKLGICNYGGGPETPRHLLVHYPKQSEYREKLRKVSRGRLDFRKLLDTPEGAGVTSHWIVHSG